MLDENKECGLALCLLYPNVKLARGCNVSYVIGMQGAIMVDVF